MSLKAFHLIFVTLLTGAVIRLRGVGVSGGQCALGCDGDCRRSFGDRLWHLFFEETEKRQLPVKSAPRDFISRARRSARRRRLFACAACYGGQID